MDLPWDRKGSQFTLLFVEAAQTLLREFPVSAAARIIEITDKRLWGLVNHYVSRAFSRLNLSSVTAVAFDETALKKDHNYVTVFIDLDRKDRPVIFVILGKGKESLI